MMPNKTFHAKWCQMMRNDAIKKHHFAIDCKGGLFRKPTSHTLPYFFSKTHQSSLTLNEGFFLKSPRPSLPLKRAPPLSPSPFPLRGQGMCQPPYSVLKPLRYKVGGPSEVFASSRAAVFCAGINPLSLKDLLRGCLMML